MTGTSTQHSDEAALDQAAQAAGLNVEAVRAQVEAVLGEALYWFPARKGGAEVVFMDLPHHALIRPAPKGDQPAPPPVEHESEQLLAESGFYHKLAEVAGYRSWPEAWDSLFEVQSFASAEAFRR